LLARAAAGPYSGDTLQYAWTTVEAPVGATVSIVDPAAPITDVELAGEGLFRLGLTVTDEVGQSSTIATYDVALTNSVTSLDPARC
jgi:hypothetical protein